MEIKTNRIDTANATIEATILKEVVDKNIENIVKELQKTASVQGFRKGKVPASVIEKQQGEKLIRDAESEALREVLSEGLTELDIPNEELIGEPNIYMFEKTDDKIEVAMKVAMRPVVELGDYDEMIKSFDKPSVEQKDIDDRIKDIAESRAPLESITDDRNTKKDDIVVIDFIGSIDGENFEGGSAKDFELVLGSGQFIPGFEDQLIDVEKGSDVVVKVKFPDNYQGKDLAGKDAEFAVKVNDIKIKTQVQIDDDFARTLLEGQDDTSLEELQRQIKSQMEDEALISLYNDELKPEILESFVSKFEFDLPEFVIEQEIDMSLNKAAQTMKEEEIKELREDEEKLNKLRDTFREDAQKSVRATFIIDALALEEEVKVEEQEVIQTIYQEAMQTGRDPRETFEQYKTSGYIPAIQMSMVKDKVLSKLLDAKMNEA
ncbi:MAG: trigger factor [Sulfurimonas sp.]|nr:trigger factor [Sulfurimonas sp.]